MVARTSPQERQQSNLDPVYMDNVPTHYMFASIFLLQSRFTHFNFFLLSRTFLRSHTFLKDSSCHTSHGFASQAARDLWTFIFQEISPESASVKCPDFAEHAGIFVAFHGISPTLPIPTTVWLLSHVAKSLGYEIHSLSRQSLSARPELTAMDQETVL